MDGDRDRELGLPPAQGDLSPEQWRRLGHEAVEWVARFLERVPELPVLARVRPGELLDELPAEGPEGPRPWPETLAELDRRILPGITHWNHPRFLAYFANTGSVPGILGALFAAALNPNAMLWRTSPAATELEVRVLEWLAAWLGLPSSMFGIINDTASVSTLVAIAAARQALPGYRSEFGLASLEQTPCLYASEQAHSSVQKAALVLGLGGAAVRTIPTDPRYRMRPEALADAVAADRRRGRLPFCVVATAGTTSTTSIDPLARVADVCAEHGLWLHVDAAYGGAAAIVPELRPLLAGWERADSIVVNPHKWLFTPMCCSVLFTRRPEDLRAAFSLVPEYLRSDVGAGDDDSAAAPPDYMNYGIQLGRPFRALPLWLVMRTYGRRGIAHNLRRHVQLAAGLAARIDAHPDFERLAPTPLSTVCFRYRRGAGAATGDGTELAPVGHDPWAAANERLLRRTNERGTTFLSHTRLRGRLALRLAIGNLRTSEADVGLAWRTIEACAAEIDE